MTLAEMLALSKAPKAQARSLPPRKPFHCPDCGNGGVNSRDVTHAKGCSLAPRPKAQARPLSQRKLQFRCPHCYGDFDDAGMFVHAQDCHNTPEGRRRIRAKASVEGLSVCMTGFRDADMEANIVAAGGSIASGVSKNLGILVAKDPRSTSGKAQRARELGIPVLSIAQMNARLL